MSFVADAYIAQWLVFWKEMELVRAHHCAVFDKEQQEWKGWKESNARAWKEWEESKANFSLHSNTNVDASDDMDLEDMDLTE